MRTSRPARTLAVAAALTAGLATVLVPGTATATTAAITTTAAADDRIDCEFTLPNIFQPVTYTCKTETEDIRWRITVACAQQRGIEYTSSAIVEGSGTTSAGCAGSPIGTGSILRHHVSVLN